MTRAILVLALTVITVVCTGCEVEPESSATAGRGIVVEKLFTHDGITVYRFEDGGRSRYFASRGSVQSDDVSSNGKTTSWTPQEILTVQLDGVTVKGKGGTE